MHSAPVLARHTHSFYLAVVTILGLGIGPAAAIDIVNPSFEDTTGHDTHFEFTFGVPVGWTLHDPDGIVNTANNVYVGTLAFPTVFFDDETAPDGDRVAILYNGGQEGEGEYGYTQILGDTLQPFTEYTLTVAVGNIGSGTSLNGTPYDLSEFPGYRVELFAGTTPLAQDDNSLTIPEYEFATSTVTFTTGATHVAFGEALGIRLVNLNEIPEGFNEETSPDLEVDFDDVVLTATAVPEPSTLLVGVALLMFRRRRRA